MKKILFSSVFLILYSNASADRANDFIYSMFGNLGIIQTSTCNHPVYTSPQITKIAQVQCGRTEFNFTQFRERWDLYSQWESKTPIIPKSLTPWREAESGNEWERIYEIDQKRLITVFKADALGGEITTIYSFQKSSGQSVGMPYQSMPASPELPNDVKSSVIKFLARNGYKISNCQNGTPQAFGRIWTLCFTSDKTIENFKSIWPRIKPELAKSSEVNAYFDWNDDGKGGVYLNFFLGKKYMMYASYIQKNSKITQPTVVISLVARE